MRGAVVVGVVLAAAGCKEPGPAPPHVVVTGSYTMAPLVHDIAARFEANHPGLKVDVQAVGSARGVRDAQQGLADVGMVARALHADETGLHAHVLARDGVAVIVHRDNPVKELAEVQVVGLFTHATATWKPLGGPDVPTTVVALPDERALAQAFTDHYNLKAGQVRPDVRAADGATALKAVAARTEAVGYASVGEAAAAGLSVRLLPSGGVAATPANVAGGTYPFVRPLLLVTRDPPSAGATDFVAFARSEAVRDLLAKYNVAPPQK
jgi:phosphate transport system substrate-binding protein